MVFSNQSQPPVESKTPETIIEEKEDELENENLGEAEEEEEEEEEEDEEEKDTKEPAKELTESEKLILSEQQN